MSLPPGATLVSGSLPDASQLPPGATLVSGDLPTPAQPGVLDKANEYAGKALSAAGLPTSISNVPDWFRHLTGTHPDSEPFWEPIRRAIKNPTQENIVGAVPFIGPSSVAMSKDVRAGDYGGAAATLAGTVGGVVGPTKAPEIAAGLSDATQAVKNAPAAIADAAQNGLRDPITGKLKPGVKTAAKVVGGVAGAAPGLAHGNLPLAYVGGEAGSRTLPAVVDAVTPVSAAQKQLATDATAMRTRNLQARIAESKAADAAGQTITEYRANQRAAAKAAAKAPPEPEPSPIVTPQTAPSEGRPATWRDFTGDGKIGVADLSRSGGPLSFDAAKQAQLRQLDVPDVGLVANPRATSGGADIGSSSDRLARLRDIAGYKPAGVDAMADVLATKRLKLGEPTQLGEGFGNDHIITNKDGERVGSIQIEPKGDKAVHVHWLGGDLQPYGRGPITDAIKEQYPGTEKITYDRRRLAKGADAATTEPREMTLSGS